MFSEYSVWIGLVRWFVEVYKCNEWPSTMTRAGVARRHAVPYWLAASCRTNYFPGFRWISLSVKLPHINRLEAQQQHPHVRSANPTSFGPLRIAPTLQLQSSGSPAVVPRRHCSSLEVRIQPCARWLGASSPIFLATRNPDGVVPSRLVGARIGVAGYGATQNGTIARRYFGTKKLTTRSSRQGKRLTSKATTIFLRDEGDDEPAQFATHGSVRVNLKPQTDHEESPYELECSSHTGRPQGTPSHDHLLASRMRFDVADDLELWDWFRTRSERNGADFRGRGKDHDRAGKSSEGNKLTKLAKSILSPWAQRMSRTASVAIGFARDAPVDVVVIPTMDQFLNNLDSGDIPGGVVTDFGGNEGGEYENDVDGRLGATPKASVMCGGVSSGVGLPVGATVVTRNLKLSARWGCLVVVPRVLHEMTEPPRRAQASHAAQRVSQIHNSGMSKTARCIANALESALGIMLSEGWGQPNKERSAMYLRGAPFSIAVPMSRVGCPQLCAAVVADAVQLFMQRLESAQEFIRSNQTEFAAHMEPKEIGGDETSDVGYLSNDRDTIPFQNFGPWKNYAILTRKVKHAPLASPRSSRISGFLFPDSIAARYIRHIAVRSGTDQFPIRIILLAATSQQRKLLVQEFRRCLANACRTVPRGGPESDPSNDLPGGPRRVQQSPYVIKIKYRKRQHVSTGTHAIRAMRWKDKKREIRRHRNKSQEITLS